MPMLIRIRQAADKQIHIHLHREQGGKPTKATTRSHPRRGTRATDEKKQLTFMRRQKNLSEFSETSAREEP